MILFVVLDDKGGMLFNKRRQSQDELLRMRIIELSKDSKLLMNAYSAKQFANNKIPNLQVTPDPLEEAQAGQYCFVENIKVDNCEPQLEKIVIYKWNRRYPGDLYFNIPLEEHGWNCVSSSDFPGSSHEKITEEIYVKADRENEQ